MDSKELRGLYEAYNEVYAPQEVGEEMKPLPKNKMFRKAGNLGRDIVSPAIGDEDRQKKYGRQKKIIRQLNKANEQLEESGLSQDTIRSAAKERQKRVDAAYAKDTPQGDAEGNAGMKKLARTKRQLDINKPREVRMRANEEVDIFDAILEYLVTEGYADTNESALVIMANMSEEWRQSIVEADSIAAMRERAAKRRKQRYGASDTSRGGRDDFAPIKDYAAANKKWDRPHAQKESFNIFVNSMIAEGVSMEQYTWEEIQNVFDDLFEAQVANRNPDEYERKEKKGQSREQQLKGRVMGRMSQMDPDKKAAMLKQMRAVGLDV